MAKLGLVLSVISLGLAAWLVKENSDLSAQVASLEHAVGETRTVAREAPGGVAERPIDTPEAPPAAEPAAGEPAPGRASPSLAARVVPAGTSEERIARLESELAAAKKSVADLGERFRSGGPQIAFDETMGGKFLHSLDAASKALNLDERQKAGMERTLEDAKRELADLHEVKNDDGTSWNEAMKVKFEGSAESGLIAFAGNMAKLEKFKKTRIPGSRETFGEADQRIRKQAKEGMRSYLNPDQAKKWDNAHTDAMLGGGGDAMTFAFSTSAIDVVTDDDKSK